MKSVRSNPTEVTRLEDNIVVRCSEGDRINARTSYNCVVAVYSRDRHIAASTIAQHDPVTNQDRRQKAHPLNVDLAKVVLGNREG